MVKKEKIGGKRLFVLDTNVLIHDPTAIFRFHEHDVYLPIAVLEELDNHKRGMSEISRNARQASRFINDLLVGKSPAELNSGIALLLSSGLDITDGEHLGRLHFHTKESTHKLPKNLATNKPDNDIIGVALSLKDEIQDATTTLVSKDINLRIKAAIIGIHTEDYFNDQVLDDVNLLYGGSTQLPDDFWETHSKEMESWQEEGRTFYRIKGPLTDGWIINQLVYKPGEEEFDAIVREHQKDGAVIELIKDYRSANHSVWGISARNREQNFALNLLMDPAIDFVSLLGTAGTGKTLLALAAGLSQALDENRYKDIIMTRATVPVGDDIGFLPGTEEEKMTPWMGALMDNLEVLTKTEDGGDWGRAATNDVLRSRIKIRSLNFMRGRTFLNKYIIIDEAQNITGKQMKTLVTRAGPGTKVICLGNVAQIDTPYITETSSGLTYAVDRFKTWEHSGHITLLRGERSRLADFAAENL